MSEDSIKNPPTADNNFGPKQICQCTNLTVNLNLDLNSLRQDSIFFVHENVIMP